jgi:hypothetical protein
MTPLAEYVHISTLLGLRECDPWLKIVIIQVFHMYQWKSAYGSVFYFNYFRLYRK